MPEQISKYPDVTIKVLKGAGARCGEGVERKILTKCPPERFCSFPSGEICVYGIKDIPQMTQISTQGLARVVCPSGRSAGLAPSSAPGLDAMLFGAVFVAGFVLRGWRQWRPSNLTSPRQEPGGSVRT